MSPLPPMSPPDAPRDTGNTQSPHLDADHVGAAEAQAVPSAAPHGEVVHTGHHTLDLLEERAVVDKYRQVIGQVSISKHTRTRTVNVPIELVEEVLSIELTHSDATSEALLNQHSDDLLDQQLVQEVSHDSGTPHLTLNGKSVHLTDAPLELVIARQTATISKTTHVVEEIKINKTQETHQDSISIELQHEVLDVDEQGELTRPSALRP